MTAAGRRAGAAALALVAAACLPLSKQERAGSLLPEAPLAALHDGATTRRQVLDALGPPTAIVRRGDASVAIAGLELADQGGLALLPGPEASSAAFFEPFQGRRPALAPEVVYYYETVEVRVSGLAFVLYPGLELPAGSSREGRLEQLWVLVDDATGVVTAHVGRRSEPVTCESALVRAGAAPAAPLTRAFRCAGAASPAAEQGSPP
jgi:hypothetical protein